MRLCRVSPKFQCLVVIKDSDVKTTPAPYLNRFEKYSLTHSVLLEEILSSLPKRLRLIVKNAKQEVHMFIFSIGVFHSINGICICVQVEKFINDYEPTSFYGYCDETVNSLVLSCLNSNQTEEISSLSDTSVETCKEFHLLKCIVMFCQERIRLSTNCVSVFSTHGIHVIHFTEKHVKYILRDLPVLHLLFCVVFNVLTVYYTCMHYRKYTTLQFVMLLYYNR